MKTLASLCLSLVFSFSLMAQSNDCEMDGDFIPNGTFDEFVLDSGADPSTAKPKCFKFRTPNCDIPQVEYTFGHDIDTNENDDGKCGRFYNPIENGSKPSSYSGFYKISDGSTLECTALDVTFEPNYLPIKSGNEYEFSFFFKTGSDFAGAGIMAQIVFYEGTTKVDNANSDRDVSQEWKLISVKGVAPSNANALAVVIYYKGVGTAWVDNARINLTKEALAPNLGFEIDEDENGLPDHFGTDPSSTACNDHETEWKMTYAGKGAALFNATGSPQSCYYQAGYSEDGSTSIGIDVVPGEEYKISGYARRSPDFDGVGISLSALFNDSNGPIAEFGPSDYGNSYSWEKLELLVTVPLGAETMTPMINYDGMNMAWFDHMSIKKVVPLDLCPLGISQEDAPLNYFEGINPDYSLEPVSQADMITKFEDYHDYMETIYFEDGKWGPGFGSGGTICNGQYKPMIRKTANAVIGYLNAYCVIPNCVYLDRAREGLGRLLEEQSINENNSFRWYTSCKGELSHISAFYEGSIACMALLKGYEVFGNELYLTAAKDFCDYLLTVPANANANYTAFGLWALSEYLKVVEQSEAEPYLCKALEYFNFLVGTQLDNGMSSNLHNQQMNYHGIITRGLVNFLSVLPADNPKYGAVEHTVYKAINHIMRNQTEEGRVIKKPCTDTSVKFAFPIDAVLMANQYLSLETTPGYLMQSLELFTHGAEDFSHEAVQGHQFATIGLLLSKYYLNPEGTCYEYSPLDCPVDDNGGGEARIQQNSFAVWPNPATQTIQLQGEGRFELYDTAGRLLRSNLLTGEINVEALKPGVYFIKGDKEIQRLLILR